MKLSYKMGTACVALSVGLFALAGCAAQEEATTTASSSTPEGAAPVLPASHEGRYERLGAEGCFGCHGSGEEADPFLKQAGQMPDNHYANEDRTAHEIDGTHRLCNSCHVQSRASAE